MKSNAPEFPGDPSLTDKYPAIDGIPTAASPGVWEGDFGGPRGAKDAKEAIRPDVLPILQMTAQQYEEWHGDRMRAIERRLNELKLICTIPNLRYEVMPYNFNTFTQFKNEIECLNRAKETLRALSKRRTNRS